MNEDIVNLAFLSPALIVPFPRFGSLAALVRAFQPPNAQYDAGGPPFRFVAWRCGLAGRRSASRIADVEAVSCPPDDPI